MKPLRVLENFINYGDCLTLEHTLDKFSYFYFGYNTLYEVGFMSIIHTLPHLQRQSQF